PDPQGFAAQLVGLDAVVDEPTVGLPRYVEVRIDDVKMLGEPGPDLRDHDVLVERGRIARVDEEVTAVADRSADADRDGGVGRLRGVEQAGGNVELGGSHRVSAEQQAVRGVW